MDNNTRNEIAEHAVRWCCNILTEILGNHGKRLSVGKRQYLKEAVLALGNFSLSRDDQDD